MWAVNIIQTNIIHININGDIPPNGTNLLIGKCTKCNRKISMIGNDNTIKAEGLGQLFISIGKISTKACKKIATNVLKNLGRALEIGANICIAAVSKNFEATLSTIPIVVNFYHTAKGLCNGKFT